MHQQLPLGFEFNNELTFDSFVSHGNQEAVNAIHQLVMDGGERYVYLWGTAGTGKSHLLQALCQDVAGKGSPVALLTLHLHEQYEPGILDGLENLALICIDNVQAIAGLADWEEALFYLFNRAREKRKPLLITADVSHL